jgi:hypothetical protein
MKIWVLSWNDNVYVSATIGTLPLEPADYCPHARGVGFSFMLEAAPFYVKINLVFSTDRGAPRFPNH